MNCPPIRDTGNVLGNNRMFSQETITDVHLYAQLTILASSADTSAACQCQQWPDEHPV